ncbi:amidohydrolase family protein [Actinomadura sp. CNU-125]|uniref:amidohydrolase family protein n=1 Tax=Actinomadura sp. CNU-125 TaxID=1904961 RepID=UPI00096A5362|nr:amidohydrolase family protein [Actinomadura sp. CNU-125]
MTESRSGPRSDAGIAGFWRELGLPGLIDVHTHFMPPRLMSAVWDYFDEAGPLIGTEWPIRYRHSEDERVAFLRDHGVRAFTSLLYPHRPGMAESLNEWAAGFAARIPECVQTGTFYPEPNAVEYVRRAIDSGTRVFKVHLQVGGFDPRVPELDDVWGASPTRASSRSSTPDRARSPTASRARARFGDVLARHPRLTTIVAHMGAPECDGFIVLADRYDGVHLDTTMVFTDFGLSEFPAALMPRLRELGLAGRVLFGTDFPNIPYEYAHQLEGLARLGLGDDWLRAVCWDGPAKLLGVQAPA